MELRQSRLCDCFPDKSNDDSNSESTRGTTLSSIAERRASSLTFNINKALQGRASAITMGGCAKGNLEQGPATLTLCIATPSGPHRTTRAARAGPSRVGNPNPNAKNFRIIKS